MESHHQQRLNHIVHVVEVAHLQPVAEDVERLPLQQLPEPPADERLSRVADAHTRAVGVGQPQRDGAQAVDLVVNHVVPLAGQLVDAVDIGRLQRVALVHRQILRAAVDLPRAGEDDLGRRVAVATRLQQRELAADVDLQVGVGVSHAVGVADLPGQVEDDVLPLHQIAQAVLVAHIGDVDPQPVFHAVDVEDVAAVFGDQRIHNQHIRPQAHQPVGQI